MRATERLLYPASRFVITSLREQTGVSDHLCRCVCTAAPPAVVAAPQVVVLDLSSDEEQVNKEEADTEVDTDEDEVEQVAAVTAPPPAPAPYVNTVFSHALLDWVFDD